MAAFADALDLKTAVGDHIGNRSVSDVWPRLVQQAETNLNQRLRTVWQVTDATLTFVDGEAPLPADFLEMISVDGRRGYQMRADAVKVKGYEGDKDVSYYASIPTISGSLSATNWLLERFGDVYLYGVALQAAKYLKDVELSQATDQLLGYALQAVKIEDDRHRWSNSIVRVQGCTP